MAAPRTGASCTVAILLAPPSEASHLPSARAPVTCQPTPLDGPLNSGRPVLLIRPEQRAAADIRRHLRACKGWAVAVGTIRDSSEVQAERSVTTRLIPTRKSPSQEGRAAPTDGGCVSSVPRVGPTTPLAPPQEDRLRSAIAPHTPPPLGAITIMACPRE